MLPDTVVTFTREPLHKHAPLAPIILFDLCAEETFFRRIYTPTQFYSKALQRCHQSCFADFVKVTKKKFQ